MVKAGTIDKAAYDKLPPVSGTPVVVDADQTTKAADVAEQGMGQGDGLIMSAPARPPLEPGEVSSPGSAPISGWCRSSAS